MLNRGALKANLSFLAMAVVLFATPRIGAFPLHEHSETMKGSAHGSLAVLDGPMAACVACHVDLREDATGPAPLWDPSAGKRQFEAYGGVSQVCLSCHDDIVARSPPTSANWRCCAFPGPEITAAGGALHHPVAVPYGFPPRLDLLSPRAGANRRVRLYNAWGNSRDGLRVECASCHDPHHPENLNFLRVTPAQQELCKCCHEAVPELSRHVYIPIQRYDALPDDCRTCHQK